MLLFPTGSRRESDSDRVRRIHVYIKNDDGSMIWNVLRCPGRVDDNEGNSIVVLREDGEKFTKRDVFFLGDKERYGYTRSRNLKTY